MLCNGVGESGVHLERFIEDCVAANAEDDAQAAVTEVLARAVSEPCAIRTLVGDPCQAELKCLHRSSTLTIVSVTWTPRMNVAPHNHLMWASIGIYAGREDNILWRRAQCGRIGSCGAKALFERDVAAFPADVIHSVTNPLTRFTGGIHIYGGDFFAKERSLWDAETLQESCCDGDIMRAVYDRENERYRG